jgi:hypothetical protein
VSPLATSWCKRFVTPTAASPATLEPDALVNTSVAVPLLVADHEHHRTVVDAVRNRTLGLAGHAAFETFSILTGCHHRREGVRARSSSHCTQLSRDAFSQRSRGRRAAGQPGRARHRRRSGVGPSRRRRGRRTWTDPDGPRPTGSGDLSPTRRQIRARRLFEKPRWSAVNALARVLKKRTDPRVLTCERGPPRPCRRWPQAVRDATHSRR